MLFYFILNQCAQKIFVSDLRSFLESAENLEGKIDSLNQTINKSASDPFIDVERSTKLRLIRVIKAALNVDPYNWTDNPKANIYILHILLQEFNTKESISKINKLKEQIKKSKESFEKLTRPTNDVNYIFENTKFCLDDMIRTLSQLYQLIKDLKNYASSIFNGEPLKQVQSSVKPEDKLNDKIRSLEIWLSSFTKNIHKLKEILKYFN